MIQTKTIVMLMIAIATVGVTSTMSSTIPVHGRATTQQGSSLIWD